MNKKDFVDYLYNRLGVNKNSSDRDSFTNKKMDMFYKGFFAEKNVITRCWCGTKLKFANKEKQRCPHCKEIYSREEVITLIAHNKDNGIDVEFV